MLELVRRVVLVDDDRNIRMRAVRALRELLPRAVFAEAADAAGGRRLLAEGTADLVVLDHYLPDGEGLHLLTWLRERKVDVPVIYLTSVRTAEVAVAALKGGASDYVVKSREWPRALARAVQAVLEQRERRRAEQAALASLRESAFRDPLTGLWNRRVLEDDRVAATWGEGPVAVAMIDLDGFKIVNDTMGHEAGDRVLREVAALLLASIRETDLLVRYGGDEFVAVLPRMEDADVEGWVARVRDQFARGRADGRLPPALDASIGMAVGSGGLREILIRADAEMYADKRRGQAGRSRLQAPAGGGDV